ncbi:AMP-binding protein [Xiashengella succiniciproducens]|uniref:AMP-binding protein n=1 Tax=Xiashengella succiniciproducens TaxID=2949635 RepID=A0A9J6ZSL0_9BACT|nr:AMP-binding protein [Alkaliflexus sp. Ai-910]URW80826.1 AMP-binding protein [Alkaliflexus sp. Ai-910]
MAMEIELIDYTLGQMLEKWVKEEPNNDFMVYPDRGLRLTYAEFNDRVNQMAKGFMEIGVTKGSHVGIWANNVPDWLTIMFATAKIGAVLVTVNTNYKLAELEYIIKNADLHTLCIIDGYRDSDYVSMTFELVPELKNCQRGHLKSARFPELKNVVFVGPQKHRGMYNTPELMALGSQVDDKVLDDAAKTFDCHDVVNMQYTSGTTGFPKGVMLTHHNILNNGNQVGNNMHYTCKDRLLLCVPLFHCFGCVLAVCAAVTHGVSMVLVEDFDALRVLAGIQKEKCTAVYGVPTMFIAELHHPMFEMFDLSTLRTGIMAGALCPVETMKQVMEKMHCKDIIIVYGLTETSPGMTTTRVFDPAEIRATTVGVELPGVEVKIVNPETGEECGPEEHGEICCRGYNVMKGYYKNPEATALAIDKDGWLHSGDLAMKTKDGFYKITGRIKDMIIRGGENVYPREIENFIFNMPQVELVEVVGIPDQKYGEIVGAFVKVKKGQQLCEAEVQEFCRGKIARYKIPKHVFFVDDFPKTASGKVMKYKLREMAVALVKQKENA